MSADRTPEYLQSLTRELSKLPRETGWLEFKENAAEAQVIGEYISALSNSAALDEKAYGYLLWGIRDGSHDIVGTTFRPASEKVGNEELENWLLKLLSPKIHFRFYETEVNNARVVILEVERAARTPVQFYGHEYIRIGSYKKKLKDFPNKERDLWRIFDRIPFENGAAAEQLLASDIIALLDFPSYFDLLKQPMPENGRSLLSSLQGDNLIQPQRLAVVTSPILGRSFSLKDWILLDRYSGRSFELLDTVAIVAWRQLGNSPEVAVMRQASKVS